MFISYGTKATLLSTKPIMTSCPNCGKLNTMHMSVYQWYSHIFWIPFFPARKQGVSHCSNCMHTIYQKQFNFALQEHYARLRTQVKTPIWTFTFSIIIAFSCALYIIYLNHHDKQNALNILNPQKGDIYEVKFSNSGANQKFENARSIFSLTLPPTNFFDKFTLYKVDSVGADYVYLIPNKYETNLDSGLDELNNDTSFEVESFYMSKEELKTHFDEGDILDIDRK